MEYDNKYASNAKGNAALTTGIIGTAGVGLNLLGNLLGGNGMANWNGNGYGCGAPACSDNTLVNRYEAQKDARIAELETEVKLRDANFYTIGEIGKLRDYVDTRFSKVESELCEQKVFNATQIGTISCIQGQIAKLMGLTKLSIPNESVCPGWGDVTVTITPTTAT